MSSGFGDLNILRLASEFVGTPKHFLFPSNPTTEDALRFLRTKDRKLKFGKMFPNLPEFRPPVQALVELGQAMEATSQIPDNDLLTAGHTYLGQFVDHDITFDLTKTPPVEPVPIPSIQQGRTPSLDMDSLYGDNPGGDKPGRQLYEDDGIRLRTGTTKPDFALNEWRSFPNDLIRTSIHDQRAVIGDPRNDENLVVAQTSLAFTKFHNAVVETLADNYAGEELFRQARKKVVKHYQWIVVHDFLGNLIDPFVLNVVLREGCKHFLPPAGQEPFMPVEFARAAFRVGHSQVRDEYEWNRIFERGLKAQLSHLLALTGFQGNNLFSNDRLPTTWIIDWTRFFNFAGYPGRGANSRLNFTKKLDTSLARAFAHLPIPSDWPSELRSLAVIDLLRGWEVGLPAAQTIVGSLKQSASQPDKIRELTPDEIAGKHPHVITKYGFDKATPLWYYVLREAEVIWNGNRLGPVASYIIAETFVGLIKASATSIFRRDKPADPDWRPDLGIERGRFTMADMLYFVNDLNPVA